MVSTLIIVFLVFLVFLLIYLFKVGFVRGEIYDVTKGKPRKGSKNAKFLKDVLEGIKYINSKEYEWLYIMSADNIKLSARYFRNGDSKKIILLFHGYRSVAENDFAGIFDYYYEEGYNILLIDQRAHGKSEGKYITFGVKERIDCLKWCEYINKKFPDLEEIILAGISMGATTVLLSTGLNLPEKVKGIIADCGFTSPRAIITKVVSRKFGVNVNVLLPLVNLICRIVVKFNIYECSVTDVLKYNKIPILFIHGTSDGFVPSKMSKENFEACRSKKKLILIDCVMHGGACLQDKVKVRNEIGKFLKEL